MGVEIGGGIIIVPPQFPAHGKSGFEKRRVLHKAFAPFFSALAPNIVQPLVSDSDTPLTRRHVVVDVQQPPFPPAIGAKGPYVLCACVPYGFTYRKKCDRPPRRRAARWGRPR